MSQLQDNSEFLTPEECVAVDQALLSSRDKFSTRVAIYALRSLKQIAVETGTAIEQVTPEQVMEWVKRDRSAPAGLETDASFVNFFVQLVLSALKPLRQISDETKMAIATLTPDHIIAWFEKEAKQRIETSLGNQSS
jgi:hypothetical protein